MIGTVAVPIVLVGHPLVISLIPAGFGVTISFVLGGSLITPLLRI